VFERELEADISIASFEHAPVFAGKELAGHAAALGIIFNQQDGWHSRGVEFVMQPLQDQVLLPLVVDAAGKTPVLGAAV
jgi:hypothetical protein